MSDLPEITMYFLIFHFAQAHIHHQKPTLFSMVPCVSNMLIIKCMKYGWMWLTRHLDHHHSLKTFQLTPCLLKRILLYRHSSPLPFFLVTRFSCTFIWHLNDLILLLAAVVGGPIRVYGFLFETWCFAGQTHQILLLQCVHLFMNMKSSFG